MSNVKIGGGEYDFANGSAWDAQMYFLDAVAEVEPEVLAALWRDVLPLYDSDRRLSWIYSPRAIPEPLKAALLQWARRFNLNYNWAYDTALETLHFWASISAERWQTLKPETVREIKTGWQHTIHGYMLPFADKRKINFTYAAGWRPTEEQWSDAEKRMLEAFKKYLEGYRNELEAAAEARGLKKTPEVRELEQFRWLALWWVGDYDTFGKLAAAEHISRQGITLGIQRAARLCGLPIPKGEPGRPGKPGKPASKPK